MGRRTWIKIFADNWLRGTLREETATLRGIWVDILALAGDSAYGDEGCIALADDVGLTDEQITAILKLEDIDDWKQAKKRLEKTERIQVLDKNIIKICNWKKYQSEYERQKPHREVEFVRLRESVKERDGYVCQLCNKSENELKIPLCIHHINNDPKDNREENLITLCMSCHSHLLKKAVHPTKDKERKIQEKQFNKKVQQKGAVEKEKEKEIEKEIKKDIKNKDQRKPSANSSNKKQPFPPPTQEQKKELALLNIELSKMDFNLFFFLQWVNKVKGFFPPIDLVIKISKSVIKNKPTDIWAYYIGTIKKEQPTYFADLQIAEHQRFKKMPIGTSVGQIIKDMGK